MKLQNRALLERAIGSVLLVVLVLYAYLFQDFISPLTYLAITFEFLSSMPLLIWAAGVGLLGVIALAAWAAVLLPPFRRHDTGPSFARALRFLVALIDLLLHGKKPVLVLERGPPKTMTQMTLQAAAAALSLAVFAGVWRLAQDWLLLMLIAAIIPICCISCFRLAVAPRMMVAYDQAEYITLALVSVVAVVFVLLVQLGRDRAEADRRVSDGYHAAILAAGVLDDASRNSALYLALIAHQNQASWLSGSTLRSVVEKIPLPVATITAKSAGAFGPTVERLDQLSVSRTGRFVAGSTLSRVYVWEAGTEPELGGFDCAGFNEPLVFSEDESVMAAVCRRDGSLRIWHVKDRRETRSESAQAELGELRVGPDSRFAAVVQNKTCLLLFLIIETPRALATHCDSAPIVSVVFDRGGEHLAIARRSESVTVEFIDAVASPNTTSNTAPVAWAPTVPLFAAITDSDLVTIYDWKSLKRRTQISHPSLWNVFTGGDGDHVITISRHGELLPSYEVKVWRLSNETEIAKLRIGSLRYGSITVNANATAITWQDEYNKVFYWSVNSPAVIEMRGDGPIAISADGSSAATGSASRGDRNDVSGRLWSLSNDRILLADPAFSEIQFDPKSSQAAALYPDQVVLFDLLSNATTALIPESHVKRVHFAIGGEYAATVTQQNKLAFWSLTSAGASKLEYKQLQRDEPCLLAFAPMTRAVAVTSCAGSVQILSLPALEPIMILQSDPNSSGEMTWSSDGQLLAINNNVVVRVADIFAKSEVLAVPVPRWQRSRASIRFQPSSHHLIMAYDEQPESSVDAVMSMFKDQQRIALWDVDRRQKIKTAVPAGIEPTIIGTSSDGKQVALSVANGRIEVLSLPDLRMKTRIDDAEARTIAFTEDNRLLVTFGTRGVARVWSVDSAFEVDRLSIEGVFVRAVVGHKVVTISSLKEIRRWSVDPTELIAAGCARLHSQSEVLWSGVLHSRPACPETVPSR